MKEVTGVFYYSTNEVAKICGLSIDRIKKGIKIGFLEAKKVSPQGRYGSFGCTKEAIEKYAKKIGITPVYEALQYTPKKEKSEKNKNSETSYYAALCVIKVGNKYATGLMPSQISLTSEISKALIITEETMDYVRSVLEEIGAGELCPIYIRK